MKFVFLICLFIADQAMGESLTEYLKIHYLINEKFRIGEHLIYHCEDQYFACVDLESLESCEEQKDRCLPLNSFPSMEECFKGQEKGIISGKGKALCAQSR